MQGARATYAEDLPYWKTSTSAPDRWLERAAVEIERAGGEIVSDGYGRVGDQACFMLRFQLHGEHFRITWPVLKSKNGSDQDRGFLLAARRQAATMLYHDVKSCCVKARALGARIAFFAHLEIGNRVASELGGGELLDLPKLLAAAPVEAEIIE